MTRPNQLAPLESAPVATFIDMHQAAHTYPDEVAILQTDGLGPCIGIAVYDPVLRQGHMAHIPTVWGSKGYIETFWSRVTDGTDKDSLQVWLRGGMLDNGTPNDLEFSKWNREVTLRGIEAAGIPIENVDVGWDPRPVMGGGHGTFMQLDTRDGSFYSQVGRPADAMPYE